MYKLLGGLANYLKWQPIKTDCVLFRLHNTFTAALLIGCSLVITATQFVGNPIQCIVSGLPTHVINTYCWISSTFTMPDAFRREVGREVAHPGVDNDYGNLEAQKYYTYYQWVCFALFFQGLLCYTPKFIWDAFEGGLMQTIVMGLNMGVCTEEEKQKKKSVLIDYLMAHIKRHNMYAFRYWVCEFLCLINIMVQLYFMNIFFNGEFLSYGFKVMSYSEAAQEDRRDPMIYVFPRVTKCTFHKYGASGTIQKHDSLCVLPLNIVNEKTYIFIWFWYMVLVQLLALLITYRAVIISWPRIRSKLLHARNRSIPREICESVSRKVDIGDWWIIYMLGNNIDPLIFREVLAELAKKIETRASNQQ